jgi:recombination protein RecA
MTGKLNFIDSFIKEVNKLEGIGTSSAPPRYWYSTGNYVLNKIISGSFYKGIPQGRITNFAGPSGAGKSFLTANIVREAQKSGAMILIVDTENALDDEFMTKIGVDVNDKSKYFYFGVSTIQQAVNVISQFLKGYKEEYNNDVTAPQVLIVLDSLDMMLTETELENYEKGIQKGDQGQKNKQLKMMLRTFTQDIKTLNVAMICTSQVYRNQDILNGEGVWIVSDAVKYSASQIVLLNKLKLKDGTEVKGIRMKCEGYKTRFTKPFQTVVIEVPYETGMDPYSGLVETAINLKIVEKAGSRYRIVGNDETWYERDIHKVADKILTTAESAQDAFLGIEEIPSDEIDVETESKQETISRRKNKNVIVE